MHTSKTMPNRLIPRLAVACCTALALVGCSQGPSDGNKPPEMPRFDDPHLAQGRSVWMGTCRKCHLMGVAGAPAVTNFTEWDRRIANGKEALYHSALNGIKGPDGKYRMPPHGGNKRLSDDQVRSAVDYKVAAIEQLQREAQQDRDQD
jgi:cytochrome c5